MFNVPLLLRSYFSGGGVFQGHLMKQSKYFSRWKPRYFRLEDGFLTYYDKKALVGTHKNKVVHNALECRWTKPEGVAGTYLYFDRFWLT